MITLVLAMAENGVVGKNGTIPWRISEDMKRFKQLTMGKPVVMGRKTWDSLPKKPLPGRTNIVVTRQSDWAAEGAVSAASFEEAMDKAAAAAETMVIGGGEIYREALPLAGRIELTEIHRAFEGDTFFGFDKTIWREIAREDHLTSEGVAFSYVTLTRI